MTTRLQFPGNAPTGSFAGLVRDVDETVTSVYPLGLDAPGAFGGAWDYATWDGAAFSTRAVGSGTYAVQKSDGSGWIVVTI